MVLDIGTYKLVSHYTFEIFSFVKIEIRNDNTDKVSFNEGVIFNTSLNFNYQFEYEHETIRLITNKINDISLTVEGNAKYFLKDDYSVSDEELRYGNTGVSSSGNDKPFEIFVKGHVGKLTQVKISYRK